MNSALLTQESAFRIGIAIFTSCETKPMSESPGMNSIEERSDATVLCTVGPRNTVGLGGPKKWHCRLSFFGVIS